MAPVPCWKLWFGRLEQIACAPDGLGQIFKDPRIITIIR